MLQRSLIGLVNLAVLIIFVAVELGFSYFRFPTPAGMLVVAAVAILFRLAEIAFSRRRKELSASVTRRWAQASIFSGLIVPFLLAAATRQFHTHYFGLLILPVLEAALYFSILSTLMVASVAAISALLWVGYAAHFRPPFELGELIEATTLILVLFIVGTLVWFLLDLLSEREREIKERLLDLEMTRSKLSEGEKLSAIGRLASAVAHEIRNPVAIISSAIEAAGSDAFSDEDRAEMSRVAVAEARRLEKLTTDFLTYARPGEAPCAEVDTVALVGHISSIARAQALGKRVTIHVQAEEGCLTYGNEDQLQQALLNLMRNAIDASPEAGQVSVAVGCQGDKVRIAVENQGPPIPGYAVPRIFEPFFTAKQGGTGLGLSIARKIVEAYGGELQLEHNRAECVRFALLLPSFASRLTSA